MLIPDEISEVLGSAPTKSYVKGEHLRTTKSGEMKFAKFGMWNLRLVGPSQRILTIK